MKRKGLIVSGAMALVLATTPVSATPLLLDSGWQTFTFADVGSSWSDSFTIDITDNAWMAVTDAFLSGDQFEFFVDGLSVGQTSAPTTEGDQIGTDYNAAFAGSQWSSAELMLNAGTYNITGKTLLSPFGSGGAAIRLASAPLGGPDFGPPSAVPVPATLGLMLLGLAGLIATRRNNA